MKLSYLKLEIYEKFNNNVMHLQFTQNLIRNEKTTQSSYIYIYIPIWKGGWSFLFSSFFIAATALKNGVVLMLLKPPYLLQQT